MLFIYTVFNLLCRLHKKNSIIATGISDNPNNGIAIPNITKNTMSPIGIWL